MIRDCCRRTLKSRHPNETAGGGLPLKPCRLFKLSELLISVFIFRNTVVQPLSRAVGEITLPQLILQILKGSQTGGE
ncbi:hypothetical protein SDJN03_20239, partial [Cucurbita argyrosperma subsp. sororia]